MGSGWYLGPVGACREIPAPVRGLEVGRELIGAEAVSLGGTRTLYRRAQPRSWALSWPTLSEDELTYLRLVGLGLIGSPARLIDPMVRNLLPVQVATGGSYRRDTSRFLITGGSTMSWVAVADPPTAVPVRGAISWVRATTAAATLTGGDVADRVPLVGRKVRLGIWARGTAIAVSPAADAYNAAGSAATTTGTAATLHVTEWRYLAVDLTPAADRVSAVPVLSAANGQAASTVQTTGWQLAFCDRPAEQPQDWTEGGGAPEVLAGSELTARYERWQRHRYALLLRERRV